MITIVIWGSPIARWGSLQCPLEIWTNVEQDIFDEGVLLFHRVGWCRRSTFSELAVGFRAIVRRRTRVEYNVIELRSL